VFDGCPDLWADDQHVYVVIHDHRIVLTAGNLFLPRPQEEPRLQALDRTTGREKWLLIVKGSIADIQMIHDGLIYAVGCFSGLHVIDPAKGKKLWSFNGVTTSARSENAAGLISGNRVFLISKPYTDSHGYLYAIDKPAKFRR
jgi:outer membrane protein assembly factor BamB